MTLTLTTDRLRRYKDIAHLLWRYGRGDLLHETGLEASLGETERAGEPGSGDPAELAADLERMGPAFVKLGQLLSTRADLLPVPYLEALARLQDKVEPFPHEEVERIVSDELGVRISKAFEQFEAHPVAAASLGQVHRARLRDGREVVVKVQRPGIRREVVEDLEAFRDVARLLDRHTEVGLRYGFTGMIEEFERSVTEELDYRREAANLVALGENLARFERIVVPQPVDDYTTSRVLTMGHVSGVPIGHLSPVARVDLAGSELAEELFRAYLEQVLVDGFFHADPHPGNVFLTSDHRIALIDLGMVGRLRPQIQSRLLKALLAIAEGDGDEAAEVTLAMSETNSELYEPARYRREIARLVAREQGAELADLQVGRVMLELGAAAASAGVRVPAELTLLGKALVNLDQIGRTLDPQFDPTASIRRNAADLLSKRLQRDASSSGMMTALLDTKELVEEMPGRINRLLDTLADNQLRIRVDAIDEHELLVGLQKIANRITAGLVLAALIVGAALLMRIESAFTILGYPGLAILLFLAAAATGFRLVWSILWHDRPARKQPPRV